MRPHVVARRPHHHLLGLHVQSPTGRCRPAALYTVAASGGQPTRLTDEIGALRPEWSPDGSLVAFDAQGDDPNGSIFLVAF
jgi:Tol biopolymer transport system component